MSKMNAMTKVFCNKSYSIMMNRVFVRYTIMISFQQPLHINVTLWHLCLGMWIIDSIWIKYRLRFVLFFGRGAVGGYIFPLEFLLFLPTSYWEEEHWALGLWRTIFLFFSPSSCLKWLTQDKCVECILTTKKALGIILVSEGS